LGLITPVYCLAAVFIVDTTVDLPDIDPGNGTCKASDKTGDCSLRAAIMETNALEGPDEIRVPAGTYLLTITGDDDDSMVGDLDITDGELTITGAGTDSTIIDGNSIDRVFQMLTTGVVIQDLTIRGGLGENNIGRGGGIYILGENELLLQRVHVTNNGANIGGGLLAIGDPTVTIDSSLFSENFTVDFGLANRFGSAIYCQTCTLIINSSTFAQNFDGSEAVNVTQGHLELLNSTISGNDGGAIRTQNSNAFIKFSTIINNGGPNLSNFSFDGSHIYEIGNSVLQSDASSDCQSGDLPPVSVGYNVTSDASCAFTMTGDMQNTDAMLGALLDNGGLTLTHKPEDSSVLLDQIPILSCTDNQSMAMTVDQRGFTRPMGTKCDIGSVENPSDVNFADGFESE